VSVDAIIRVVAALAAVGLLAAPALARVVEGVRASIAARRAEAGGEEHVKVTPKDLHVVLDLATRLKAAGLAEGVTLCQQLIEVMLGNTKAKK
jgi:hypothetical protein